MGSGILDKRGTSLLEVLATVVVITCILSMIVPSNVQRVQHAQFQKTVAEMKTIAQASIDFYTSAGFCPTGTDQLAPIYMPQAVAISPFNSSYQLSCTANVVSVSVSIPTGLVEKNPEGPLLEVVHSGMQDNITITQRIPYAFIGRLLYDKKFLYGGL